MNDERSLLSEALLDMSSQLTRAQDENERLRVELRELALEAESFAIIARYQGTPLTVLESATNEHRLAEQVAELQAEVAWLIHERDEARIEIARLRAGRDKAIDAVVAALTAVEYADYEGRCPWCATWPSSGHAPDCERQSALGIAWKEMGA